MNLLKPSKDAEILVKRWGGKFFDDNGNVIDQDLKKRIGLFLNEFYSFIKANKKWFMLFNYAPVKNKTKNRNWKNEYEVNQKMKNQRFSFLSNFVHLAILF